MGGISAWSIFSYPDRVESIRLEGSYQVSSLNGFLCLCPLVDRDHDHMNLDLLILQRVGLPSHPRITELDELRAVELHSSHDGIRVTLNQAIFSLVLHLTSTQEGLPLLSSTHACRDIHWEVVL